MDEVKTEQLSFLPNRDETLSEVREHVARASALLRSLGSGYERVGWMLEDAMTFLRPDELTEEPFVEDTVVYPKHAAEADEELKEAGGQGN